MVRLWKKAGSWKDADFKILEPGLPFQLRQSGALQWWHTAPSWKAALQSRYHTGNPPEGLQSAFPAECQWSAWLKRQ